MTAGTPEPQTPAALQSFNPMDDTPLAEWPEVSLSIAVVPVRFARVLCSTLRPQARRACRVASFSSYHLGSHSALGSMLGSPPSGAQPSQQGCACKDCTAMEALCLASDGLDTIIHGACMRLFEMLQGCPCREFPMPGSSKPQRVAPSSGLRGTFCRDRASMNKIKQMPATDRHIRLAEACPIQISVRTLSLSKTHHPTLLGFQVTIFLPCYYYYCCY